MSELLEVVVPYLAPDVKAELDAKACKHGRSGYKLGCRGPVCLWAEILHQRARSAAKAERENRVYHPGLRRARKDERAVELNAVLAYQEVLHQIRLAEAERAKERAKLETRMQTLITLIAEKPSVIRIDKLLAVQAQLAS